MRGFFFSLAALLALTGCDVEGDYLEVEDDDGAIASAHIAAEDGLGGVYYSYMNLMENCTKYGNQDRDAYFWDSQDPDCDTNNDQADGTWGFNGDILIGGDIHPGGVEQYYFMGTPILLVYLHPTDGHLYRWTRSGSNWQYAGKVVASEDISWVGLGLNNTGFQLVVGTDTGDELGGYQLFNATGDWSLEEPSSGGSCGTIGC